MISMQRHASKTLKQVDNVVWCYKLVNWLFLPQKEFIMVFESLQVMILYLLQSPKIKVVALDQCEDMFLKY